MAKNAGTQMAKPMVEGLGFKESLKVLNLDNFSIASGFPKYENGFALVVKLPGLTRVVEELLLK